MSERVTRARDRLTSNEKEIMKKRALSHKLGKLNPDEAVKIPKIGEWNLGQTKVAPDEKDLDILNQPVDMGPLDPLQNAPPISAIIDFNPKKPKTIRANSRFDAPYKIKAPPPVTEPLYTGGQAPKSFPAGTTSSDISQIMVSKTKQAPKPLPPLQESPRIESTDFFLPIELFDDSNYEQYPLEYLLQHPDAFSKYTVINMGTVWKKCKVLEYFPENKLFTIQWEKSTQKKKVTRFNLRFECEDEAKFNKRIEAAKEGCRAYEMEFRLNSRINQMPTTDLPELPDQEISKITDLAKKRTTKEYPKLLNNLSTEIKDEYKRLNNTLDFAYNLELNPLIPDRDEFLSLITKPPVNQEFGLVTTNILTFPEVKQNIIDEHPYENDVILSCIQKMFLTIQQYADLTFLSGSSNKLITLEAFIADQYQMLAENGKVYRGRIQETLESLASTTVTQVLNKSGQKEIHRLEKMVNTAVRMTNSQAILSAQKTLDQYLNIFQQHIDNEKEIPPQFLLDLIFDGDKGLQVIPSPESFIDQIVSVLPQLESTLLDIPTIVMPMVEFNISNMFFENTIQDINETHDLLEETLKKLFEKVNEFLDSYRFFESSLSINTDNFIKEFDPDGNRPLEDYHKQIKELQNTTRILTQEMKPKVAIGPFEIQCASFCEMMAFHTHENYTLLLKQFKQYASRDVKQLQEVFDNIMEKLKVMPTTPEELNELKNFATQVKNKDEERKQIIKKINERYDFLSSYQFEISNEEADEYYKLLSMPNKLTLMLDDAERTVQVERIRMIKDLRTNQKSLEQETTEISKQIPLIITKYQDLEDSIEAYDAVTEVDKELHRLKDLDSKYSNQDEIFGFDAAPCRPLDKLCQEFAPISMLWNLASEWNSTSSQWLDTPFLQTKPDQMNNFIALCIKKIQKLKKDLLNHQDLMNHVLLPLADAINKFKQPLQLVSKLRHLGIKTKHWEQISEIVGFNCVPTMDLTLQGFLQMDLGRWGQQITEVASVAMQEYSIESVLDKLDLELETTQFITIPFRDSGQFIISGVNDIISIIDDQLVTSQTLLSSPYIAPVKKRALERLDFLRHCHQTMEEWVTCQRQWLYLQPIFSGSSIQKKLPREAASWANVDKLWASSMTLTHNHPSFVNVMKRDKIFETFQECNRLLSFVYEGLNTYLETKRQGFPRFFFLSNDEIIAILSTTKDYAEVQKSFKKLFEYVNSLTITPERFITEMHDGATETVPLINQIDANTEEIEEWMNNFEDEMKNTLKNKIQEAISLYSKKKRSEWMEEFPAQVILISNQILWTQLITSALRSSKKKGIVNLQAKYSSVLGELTEIIRTDLSPGMRMLVSCMLIFEVHNRDIINLMVRNDVDDVESFLWEQQLRYYWEDDTVIVRSINNNYEYSYEYAGNSSRLVITPLTDRCYQTLLAAFKQNLSGAPSGPAGTGKTETVRDCAKALGRPCVVYNCSEEVTPEQMSQFFAGLATSGSWSCFDEFNRINIEVLSVIAQQLRCIQNAIASQCEMFTLDKRQLKLNPSCAICITMNPGYAGRTELPDNLKLIFRPIAMMVPDFVFICEIMLFSGGFTAATTLAVKLVAVFKLCQTQLSNAIHYDWGLRTMKTILITAGEMRIKKPDMKEFLILVECICNSIEPRLIADDVVLFEDIIVDVFPEVKPEKYIPDDFKEAIEESFRKNEAFPDSKLVRKAMDVYDTMSQRQGTMLVGRALSGKSVTWKSLRDAMNKLSEKDEKFKVSVKSMNPKAVTISELYGLFDPVTIGWSDGILSNAIREDSKEEDNFNHWIIIDGPVDSLWIESMNSLLDDNRVLCLPNNERINLGQKVKLLFETDSLAQASPATVSRCGMIYFDTEDIQWTFITDMWLDKIKQQYPLVENLLRTIFPHYIPKLIQFVTNDAQQAIKQNPLFILKNMLNIIESFFDILRQYETVISPDTDERKQVDPLDHSLYTACYNSRVATTFGIIEPEKVPLLFERIFIFAVVWSFGASLVDDSRNLFDKFLRDHMDKVNSRYQFPPKFTVFDYFVDIGHFSWIVWCDGSQVLPINPTVPIEQQFVPTNESVAPQYITRILSAHHKHTLLIGPESSKSLLVKTTFSNLPEKYDKHVIPMSNCVEAKELYTDIKSLLQKRHGAYGPLPGQSLLVFLDNIGTPKPELYGAQPPLEFIRQIIDYGGWYDTKKVEFENVAETTFISAMEMPVGHSFNIPERLLRHFVSLHIPKTNKSSLNTIITGLLTQHLEKHDLSVKELIRPTVAATIDIYLEISKTLLPVPSKPHYIFGLRNIVRVIKGIVLSPSHEIPKDIDFMHLWWHEMHREFYDRFNTEETKQWFSSLINDIFAQQFHVQTNKVIYGQITFNNYSNSERTYVEVEEKQELSMDRCKKYLEDHNSTMPKPLNIVMFQEAVDHLSSISRGLAFQRGHLMLVGLKASGRKSLARLAMYISDIQLFEIALTRTYGILEWREDIKNLLKQCGIKNQQTAFMISDYQLIKSFQLSDISKLLSDSWIYNLFSKDELEQVKTEISNGVQLDEDPLIMFKERIRNNLHIVLIVSPSSSIFQETLHSFSDLLKETTMDWFMPWSSNSLEAVATNVLEKSSISDPEMRKKIVSFCVRAHKSVEATSAKYLAEKKRYTAITPSRFFDLLKLFMQRLENQISQTEQKVKDFDSGIEKIEKTRNQIQELSKQLDIDIPILKNKQKNVEDLIKDLQKKQADVEQTRTAIKEQSEKAEVEATAAAEANKIAQEKLNEAKPILQGAQDAIDMIDRDSIVNIKQLKKIHPALREAFEAICILFGRQPRKVDSGTPGVKTEDYWPEALVLLNDVAFLKKIRNFQPDTITKETIKKLAKYVPTDKKTREDKLADVRSGYHAVGNIYFWLCSLYDYWYVHQEIIPLQNEADAAASKYEKQLEILNNSKNHLAETEEQLKDLLSQVDTEKKNVKELQDSVNITQLKLSRAQKIMVGLGVEVKRWNQQKSDLIASSTSVVGDNLLISGCLTYFGAFGPTYRQRLMDEWRMYLLNDSFVFASNFSIIQQLGNDAKTRQWIYMGLPNDSHSIENALIIEAYPESFPLLIDPQFNGTKWLKLFEGDQLKVLHFDQSDFVQQLKSCITFGLHVLIENVGFEFDPIIEPILSREFIITDGMKKISIGGEYIDYSPNFRLFMSTKYPNPHYSPEICSEVSLINFVTTQSGLSDFLMNSLIEVERDDLDKKRVSIMESNAENTNKLKTLEGQILTIVNNAGEDILSDDNAINTLTSAQKTTLSIEQQLALSAKTELQIQQYRTKFVSVAEYAAQLYFCASDFSIIDPMYQFSLMWFVDIFKKAVKEAPHPQDVNQMIASFQHSIGVKFFQSVSYSLFSKHKLLFSFLVTVRVLLFQEKITQSELAFLLSPTIEKTEKAIRWISDSQWDLVSALTKSSNSFANLITNIQEKEDLWRQYMSSTNAENVDPPMGTTPWEHLLILRVFHFDRVCNGMRVFISKTLGKEFIEPPPLNIRQIFADSNPLTPLIFVITPGIDPQDEILSVAEHLEVSRAVKFYSLGRGRGQGAEKLIEEASSAGFWVILQNCHLSLSWMPRLEHIVDGLVGNVHPRFRLCLVTMSTPQFPIGVLFRGTKLIYEIPKGVRENMMRIYSGFDQEMYNENNNLLEKQLTFHLAFFHAVVLERLQFGSLGWNVPYEFNLSDFNISRKQLASFISEAGGDVAPFESLTYVIGKLNYGGRVTDKWDSRLLQAILQQFLSQTAISSAEPFGQHFLAPPPNSSHEEVLKQINKWDVVTQGEDIGLSKNASTIVARHEAHNIFNSVIEIDPTLISTSGSSDDTSYITKLVENYAKQLPQQFNTAQLTRQMRASSSNCDVFLVCLLHECHLYNNLLSVISLSLSEAQDALNGSRLMNDDISQTIHSLVANKVPPKWRSASYLTSLPATLFIEDLIDRTKFIDAWTRGVRPKVFKLGAFFHPEEFLTAHLQLFARKNKVPFDTVRWSTKVLSERTGAAINEEPEDGLYVEGLFIEGAKWSSSENCLVECNSSDLISTLPVIHLIPTTDPDDKGYECPVFRTQVRGTGALDPPNYIMSLWLPNGKLSHAHWIQRSVAAIITVRE
ncbi:Dynein heavy chain family protein [Trichomonas vaginalis G3]|uniref:Dynein heavy chain family protein n=1 Tax=Trichomonas vaginalis (strain ATCC PRA-98 / G3) TaxID=412133 RepID=A2EK31_TRIV3|nr:dynein light chain binding [Trichomonas vaginalis G3]EAY07015.1 Dynein heavy chain family protein [Trichomonas vaginalis G3]KAI5488805.1 dynein light chain binding [Trichomonas vaginalis G3]|eukprot:XP_001319238.1 Dynein heavy chain family protein [Trichomonas vaginalis G3]